jgi:hypothetical protein
MDNMPFDGKRMIYGGFKARRELGGKMAFTRKLSLRQGRLYGRCRCTDQGDGVQCSHCRRKGFLLAFFPPISSRWSGAKKI